VSSSRIKIRIKDQGQGFDISRVDNPTKGEALMRSSGRGIYLMNSIMDSVRYKEGGRVVEIEKANTNSDHAVHDNSGKS
jgi:serine/threonine-protein kinase RsbW